MQKHGRLVLVASVILGATLALSNPTGAAGADDPAWTTAEGLVREVYAAVSATGGKTPDWDRIRGFFLPEAVIVLRTSRTATTTFSVDGFLKDFIDFYERPIKVGDKTLQPRVDGFTERVVQMKSWVFGDIAHALVLYEAHIPGAPRPPQQGIDSWELVRRDGRWWIVAVTNEIVTAERPVPPELRPGP
jgi:hypothetical protein